MRKRITHAITSIFIAPNKSTILIPRTPKAKNYVLDMSYVSPGDLSMLYTYQKPHIRPEPLGYPDPSAKELNVDKSASIHQAQI